MIRVLYGSSGSAAQTPTNSWFFRPLIITASHKEILMLHAFSGNAATLQMSRTCLPAGYQE